MDQQKDQDVPPKRRRYADEFQRDAVRLVVEDDYWFKAAAGAVGIAEQTLRKWHAKFAPSPRRAARTLR